MNENCQRGNHCLIADWIGGIYVYRCLHCPYTQR